MQIFDKNLVQLPENLSQACYRVAEKVYNRGGRALLVGGCVRDALLKRTCKDADMEVFGLDARELESLLRQHFAVDTVGKSFGVFILKGLNMDISLPRRESKTGLGHKEFQIEGDPLMTFEEASRRRDFTINAMGWDPLSGELLDCHQGQKDLASRVLRHVSGQFSEDPLRVLRAMQFAARFECAVAPETVALCRCIEPEHLPAERLMEEWVKWMEKGVRPSLGLSFLRECGWIRYYPELEQTIGCLQDSEWHPEGDVWTHTLHCMDAFARERTGDALEDRIVGFAVLCHDLGKPLTSFRDEDGRIRSPGHEIEGLKPAESFLRRLTQHKELIEAVLSLVETHMRPNDFYKSGAGDTAVRRLARKVRIDRLVRVMRADMAGRPPLVPDYTPGDWLMARAESLNVKDSSPKPLILGRHLIERGMTPGVAFKSILSECFEAQLDGTFVNLDGGLRFLERVLSERQAKDQASLA